MKFVLLLVLALGSVVYAQYPYPYDVSNVYNRNFRPPRPGNIVEGSYTFIDPSGKKRTVHYSSDGQNGFNAVLQEPVEPPKRKNKKKDTKKDDKEDDKDKTNTTTSSSDENDKKDDQKDENEDEKDPEENVRYVPVPVYPPVLGSRSSFPSQPPYVPYNRNPYGSYSSGFGFAGR